MTARFLARVPQFVDWPEAAFRSPNASLLLCVYGDYPFGISLAEAAKGVAVQRHLLEVKWVRKDEDLPACRVLYVSRSTAKRYAKVIEAVRSSITLTIGEAPEFVEAGGMIALELTDPGLRFDVNLDAVRDRHLRLSSRLLSLARSVIQKTEHARG